MFEKLENPQRGYLDFQTLKPHLLQLDEWSPILLIFRFPPPPPTSSSRTDRAR